MILKARVSRTLKSLSWLIELIGFKLSNLPYKRFEITTELSVIDREHHKSDTCQ